jgi:hypothetical protein
VIASGGFCFGCHDEERQQEECHITKSCHIHPGTLPRYFRPWHKYFLKDLQMR